MPPTPEGIVYFCEVQFQPDNRLYERMLGEMGIYIYRYRHLFADWQAVVIYPSRSIEQENTLVVTELLASNRIQRIYLDELAPLAELSMGSRLMVLTTLDGETAIDVAKQTIAQAQGRQRIIDIVTTIIVYKFNNLTREEVEAMFGIELRQTRVYQDAKAEGRQEGESQLVLRLLNRRIGNLSTPIETQIKNLSLDRLDALADALLDFQNLQDLLTWLQNN